MKDYLSFEQTRNKEHAALYTKMLKTALGDNNAVLIGHHLTFETDGILETENEIPSADCLLFDHFIMRKLFGDKAMHVMQTLAAVSVDARDDLAKRYFEAYHGKV